MRLTPDHRRKMVNVPPRCMMSTIAPQIAEMITEEQNKQQYESFLTSATNNGNLDAVVSYKEWLETIRSYTPEGVMAGTAKVRTYKEWDDLLNGDFGKQIGIKW